MTKIKICGLRRFCDIDYVNELMPDYTGFVFAQNSKRYVTFKQAEKLRQKLNDGIIPTGVFVNEDISNIEYLVKKGVIDAVQLHGGEDREYIETLKNKVKCPIIQAFRIECAEDIKQAEKSEADYIMLDSGGGTGTQFNHSLINGIKRDFFIAGGLDSKNVADIISKFKPYAVDASSSLETDGVKDKSKLTAFVNAVRDGGNKNE